MHTYHVRTCQKRTKREAENKSPVSLDLSQIAHTTVKRGREISIFFITNRTTPLFLDHIAADPYDPQTMRHTRTTYVQALNVHILHLCACVCLCQLYSYHLPTTAAATLF